ncbi:hypothetical protein [Dyella sp. 2RAB6]|uniref:hypothetical protein n=1 Tax=Dyella sp. 2RAB6 TaxID=3232992 RepID=UPI003F926AC8
MKRGTVLFVVIAAALLLGAGWQWRHDQQQALGTLLDLDPTAVQRIDLAWHGGVTEHYARRDGHWQAVDGTTLPVDEGRLADLAATAAAPVQSWRPLAEFDPARIGLAPSPVVLTLDGQALSFGEVAVTGPLRYVRAGDRVALVSVRFTPRPAKANTTKAP